MFSWSRDLKWPPPLSLLLCCTDAASPVPPFSDGAPLTIWVITFEITSDLTLSAQSGRLYIGNNYYLSVLEWLIALLFKSLNGGCRIAFLVGIREKSVSVVWLWFILKKSTFFLIFLYIYNLFIISNFD